MNNNILDTSGLLFEGDFDTQVAEILEYIRMSKAEVENLQILFDELHDIFRKRWEGSWIEVFGSIVTGLALKTSDVDILCRLPPWLSQPPCSFVIQARKILKTYRMSFKNIIAITRAKVPIVQLYHIPTKKHCDISFSGPMALSNSKLLEYYIFSDARILPLVLIIKYWSKIHNFTGQNLMPNYCCTLLVMFYLQQKNILPSFMSLQEDVENDPVDNWNAAFVQIPYKSSNNECLNTLLGDFFKYYQNLEFNKYVISLYTGCLIEKEKFSDICDSPREYNLYFANVRNKVCKKLRIDTSMCVQDPINHSRNCAVAVHPKLAERIINYFKNAAIIFDNEDSSSLLKKLLHTEETPVPINKPKLRNINYNTNEIRKSKHTYKPQWNARTNLNARSFKKKFQYYKRNQGNLMM